MGIDSVSPYLDKLWEVSAGAMALCLTNGQILKVNSAFAEMFKTAEEDCTGKNFDQMFTPAQLLSESECILEEAGTGTPVSLATFKKTGNGSLVRVFQVTAQLLTENNEKLICHMFKHVSLNSKQRNTDNFDDRKVLESTFENSFDPSLYSDPGGNIVRVNAAFHSQFNWSQKELAGENIAQMLVPESIRAEADYINTMLGTGRTVHLRTSRKRKNSDTLDVSLVCTPTDSDAETSYRIYSTPVSHAQTTADVVARNDFRNCPAPGPESGMIFLADVNPLRTMEFTAPDSASFAGYSNVELLSTPFSSIILEEDLDMVLKVLNNSLSSRNDYSVTYRIKSKSGETLWVMEHGRTYLTENGEKNFCAGCIIDISETDKDRENFAVARERIEKLHVVAGKLQKCRSEGEVYRICSQAGQSVLNGACSSVFVMDDSELKQIASAGREHYGCSLECDPGMAELAMSSPEPWYFTLRENSGNRCPAGNSGACFRLGNKAVFQIISRDDSALGSIDRRITELLLGYTQQALKRIALQHQLISQALHDPLTGIHNRNYFNRVIELEEIRARRLDSSIGFIMVDIDDFKMVNDRYGHMTGDNVLREVAGILENALRKTDLVLRYGGDEFLIILTRMTRDHCHKVEDRINAAMKSSPRLHMAGGEQITVSMGHAFWTPDAKESIDEVLGLADSLMYRNKRKKTKTP